MRRLWDPARLDASHGCVTSAAAHLWHQGPIPKAEGRSIRCVALPLCDAMFAMGTIGEAQVGRHRKRSRENRMRLVVRPPNVAAASVLSLLAAPARASLFVGEQLDAVANGIAWVALVIVPIAGIVVFWLVHIL